MCLPFPYNFALMPNIASRFSPPNSNFQSYWHFLLFLDILLCKYLLLHILSVPFSGFVIFSYELNKMQTQDIYFESFLLEWKYLKIAYSLNSSIF